MIAPDTFIKMMKRSHVNPVAWYTALWMYQADPKLHPFKLSKAIKVSWATADSMLVRIRRFAGERGNSVVK
jgi:hypothetical protein